MPTNLEIGDRLLSQAKRLGRHTTKRQAVNEALREYVDRLKRKEILALAGTMTWDKKFDPRSGRSR